MHAFARSLEILRQLRDSKELSEHLFEGELWLSLATSSVELGVLFLRHPTSAAEGKMHGVQLLNDSLALFRQAGTEDYHQGLGC